MRFDGKFVALSSVVQIVRSCEVVEQKTEE